MQPGPLAPYLCRTCPFLFTFPLHEVLAPALSATARGLVTHGLRCLRGLAQRLHHQFSMNWLCGWTSGFTQHKGAANLPKQLNS
jgi:hypothetical protein